MQKFVVKEFAPDDFPALYRCANDASASAQRWYLRWVSINLSLMVLGALVGSISFTEVSYRRLVQVVAAIFFFLALGTTILLAARRWERVWYGGRAVAESVKSLTWKFITGAHPFPSTLPPNEAVDSFLAALAEILNENKQLSVALCGADAAGEQVTAMMTGLRESAVGVLRDVYLSQRVCEQQVWYANRSASNRQHRNVWFALLVLFQSLAGVAAIILAIEPTMPWRATALFGTLAAATAAWGQVKRFQELAQAYALASQELSLISARGPYVTTREDLSRFVNDAETAISREHSMWVARRETR